ncbi:HAD-IC family P-type ATPase [Enterococcus alishanensis]|uniref:HAD-IC family P-type ATPase n=1 Tax=Enterococcus alishanensis TaxID=1303817 RepID=A0ABS6TH95_9ENTE|nr:HAD-IC family P-type ATPase [Enterococcus alishanensis]MBV7392260.1 HAD-IC family P-type ATPase [Enterococcus alishanensis]
MTIDKGLSQAAVTQRIKKGQTNDYRPNMTKSTKTIILQNTMTLFNFLNFALAAALIIVGSYSNVFFISIIIFNIVLGIVQELRAKKMVENLSLISEKKIKVRRAGETQDISPSELVLDDIVLLKSGDQVPSDLVVLEGSAEVNESLLTGESDAIAKSIDSHVLSGSYLTSGQIVGQIEHVGADNYATKIVSEAQGDKGYESELVRSIGKISKFTSWVIIPLGLILFAEALFFQSTSTTTAVVSTVAALIGMLPKGLVLLIGLALTTGVLKLAKKNVLVQNKYAIEMLAHMDILALDKTGTLTEGKMSVEELYLLNDNYRKETPDFISSYLAASNDSNLTAQALNNYFDSKAVYSASSVTAFSSERKYGAVTLEAVGTVYLGSPENLMPDYSLPSIAREAQNDGKRILLIALAENDQANLTALALIILSDPIRPNVKETLGFFKEQGVALKIISGDNPITVSAIAANAGLDNPENYIDLSTCTDEKTVREVAHQYTIFGRVTPQQKKLLINELKTSGSTVGMTGDGVNDILALREADISIAMAEGDGATRQIADVVLLNSDFATLPEIISEGRRVINNITQSSGVFFIKTIYSFLLSIFCILTATAFPFIPLQITLIDLAIEGYPAFFASFEANDKKITGTFLNTSIKRALPSALLVLFGIMVSWLIHAMGFISLAQSHSLMYFLLIGISSIGVVKSLQPFNPLRVFLAVTSIVGTFVAVLLFHKLLVVSLMNLPTLAIFLIVMLISGLAWEPIYRKVLHLGARLVRA